MKLLVILFSLFISTASYAEEIVVLVPGFFNSFTSEYFSKEVVETFENRGLKVYVAGGLNPIGTIEDNGERLYKTFEKIEALEGKKVAFNVVAHSAGGFYTLYVANKQKFEIKNLITVSTPYKGVEFIEAWLKDHGLFRLLTDLAHLDGLVQLTPEGIKTFIDSIRVSPEMKIISFGGEQSKSLDIWNARYLSLPFRITSNSISESSDGIVGFSSAMGIGEIKTTNGTRAYQFKDENFRVNLDHWEQVLNSYSFLILGIRNPSYIKNEQTRFYNGVADFLVTLL